MAKKILVVDDEAHIRQALQAALESAGYEVLLAENGRQAVETAKRTPVDLAILDVRMPVMDGHMASIEMRYDEALKHLRFMFLTANADEDSRNYAFGHGAEAYLTKPFKVAELLARVERILFPPPEPEAPAKAAPASAPAPAAPAPVLDPQARQKYLDGLKQKFKK